MRPTTKTTTTTATAPPPHNSQLIHKCPGSSPSDVGSPIAPPFTLPPRCLKLSADSKVPRQLPLRPSADGHSLPPSLFARLSSPLSLPYLLSSPGPPPRRFEATADSKVARPPSFRRPSVLQVLVRWLCVFACSLVSSVFTLSEAGKRSREPQ